MTLPNSYLRAGASAILIAAFATPIVLVKAQDSTALLSDPSGYSLVAFDTSAPELPPNYLGHNLRELYWAMERKIQKVYKDEFETTGEQKMRLISEFSQPIVGRLDIKSMFAFKVYRIDAAYDADNATLSIRCPLQRASSRRTPDAQSVSWSSEVKDEGSYVGTW